MESKRKEYLREQRWERVYKLRDQESLLYESKFLSSDFNITLSVIEDGWPMWPEREKVEFARAFSCRSELQPEDARILDFLLKHGPESVWVAIAPLLASHPDSVRATEFLLNRIQHGTEPLANYYHAVSLIVPKPEVAFVRKRYDTYRKELADESGETQRNGFWIDYLQCCKALFVMTADPVYFNVLEDALEDAPPSLRSYAENILVSLRKSD